MVREKKREEKMDIKNDVGLYRLSVIFVHLKEKEMRGK